MRHRIRVTFVVLTAFAAMALGFGVPAANAKSRVIHPASAHATRSNVTASLGKRAAAAARFKVATSPLPIRPVRPVPAGDEIVDGRGDSDGWHIYAASSADGWSWRPLATLDPFGLNPGGERWIGRQCLTGDGKYVVAVVAPWSANNSPAGLDHGGVAYVVNARTGAVHPLVSGVSLYYFTPSCGLGSSVALTAFTARDESRTTLVLANAATASVRTVLKLHGQFADAVPASGGGFFAAAGNAIVHLAAGARSVRARTPGRPFDLVANAAGGVDYLVGVRDTRASVWHLGRGRPVRAGGGAFHQLALFNGRAGHTIAAGTTRLNKAAGILALPRQPAQVEAVSLGGTAYSLAPAQSRGKVRATPGRDGALPGTPLVLASGGTAGVRNITSWLPTVAAPPTASMPRALAGTFERTASPARRAAGGHANAAAMFSSTCAVARNDVHLQAMQPSPQQVDWAANLAGRGLLTGSAARPAGYANLGLPAYSPSQDFPLPAPFGSGGDSIPREILEGVFAQESNFSQASWHSIQGVAGNPLIADYYGAGGGFVAGVQAPDCGYGIGQVTTGMQTGAMSYDLQRKVAVDYAENAAASAQILAQKWNELSAVGITANGNDPKELEDWYLALWDYNSGLHPNTGSGPWGLGWANNPANPDYPYNRGDFLWATDGLGDYFVTYQDAATPGNWPYQEKIFGWIAVPFRAQLTGLASYVGTIQTYDSSTNLNVMQTFPYGLTSPGMDDFCDSTKNSCDSGTCNRASYGSNCDPSTADGTGPCTRSDYECWWHYPDGFCSFFDVLCNTGSWEYNQGDAEPPAQGDSYPLPTCFVDPAQVPAGSDIVDSQAAAVNLAGCNSKNMNWQNNGTFAFSYGDPAVSGSQQTDMDVHQLGTGLGGHMWFTHTNEPTDAKGVSLWGVTGTWTPNLSPGRYNVKVYIPSAGASATQANYTISSGLADASRTVTVNQNSYSDAWVSLGNFWLGPGSTVSLTNLHVTSGGDLGFSGMAFIPGAPAGIYSMLGDSYSAGEGVGFPNYDADTNNYVTAQGTNNGHRSPLAANRVFATASVPFTQGGSGSTVDKACSGAVVADFYSTNPKGKCPNEPGQRSALSANSSLVTFSFGGNDLDFGNIVRDCVLAGLASFFNRPYTTCQQKDGSQFASDLTNLTSGTYAGGLPKLFAAIRAAAPNADIVVMGYPHLLIGTDAGRCLQDFWVVTSDQVWLNSVADQIDTAIKDVAAQYGFGYISTTAAFTGHELCTSNPWIRGILDPNTNDNTYNAYLAFINAVSNATTVQQFIHPLSSGYAEEAYLLQHSVQVPIKTQLSPS